MKNTGQIQLALETYRDFWEYERGWLFASMQILSDDDRQDVSTRQNQVYKIFASFVRQYPELGNEDLANQQILLKSLLENTIKKTYSYVQASADTTILLQFEQWRKLRGQISTTYENTEQINQLKGIDVRQLEEKANELERLLSKAGVPMIKQELINDWTEIQSGLVFNEAAIDLKRTSLCSGHDCVEKEAYVCLIIRPNEPQPTFVFIENGAALESLISGQYAHEINSQKEVSGLLYQAIWQSLSPHLQDVRTIYFSPDGIFHKINLATIRRPDGKYLLDDLNIVTVTNLRHVLDRGTGHIPLQSGSIVLVGNPDFGQKAAQAQPPAESTFRDMLEESGPNLQLSPLPASEREVKAIAGKALAARWEVVQLLGKKATETAVKQAKRPTVLHLATHGHFMKDRLGKEVANLAQYSKRNPALRSMLFFAGAQNTLDGQPSATGDDGILTAFEATVMPLEGTELVVLSACNTGLGKIQNGEGVIGLQRAFRIAGARTLMMTLWEVEDKATELFMGVFYDGLFAGKAKAESFRAAQLALKAKYPEPFFWGAFVLVNG